MLQSKTEQSRRLLLDVTTIASRGQQALRKRKPKRKPSPKLPRSQIVGDDVSMAKQIPLRFDDEKQFKLVLSFLIAFKVFCDS